MPPPKPVDDDTPDPRERDLSRRSQGSSVGVWAILGLILMAAAVVYIASAVL
jgi:hypothetical protein